MEIYRIHPLKDPRATPRWRQQRTRRQRWRRLRCLKRRRGEVGFGGGNGLVDFDRLGDDFSPLKLTLHLFRNTWKVQTYRNMQVSVHLFFGVGGFTLPKTNSKSSWERQRAPKRKGKSLPIINVSFREGRWGFWRVKRPTPGEVTYRLPASTF